MAKLNTFIRVLALGLPGVLAVVFLIDPPMDLPRIALAANPTVLLLLLGTLGIFTARKAGFRSCLVLQDYISWSTVKNFGLLAIAVGALIAIGDYITAPILQGIEKPIPAPTLSASLKALVIGITYGGATEEILMRWGLMSGITLGLMKLVDRSTAVYVAIALTAALFAAGHLPLLFASGDVGAPMIARVMILNGGLGLWFGWLYARHNLEAAIAAHVGFHVGVFLFSIALVAMG